MKRKRIRMIPAAVLFIGFMAGCSLFDRPIQKPKGRTADELYKEGVSALNQKNYRQAIETFYKLKYDFPSETAAMLADIKIADAHFSNKEYDLAIESYADFRQRHPTSPYIPYIIYMLGLCNYKKMQPADKDQTETEMALNEFRYLLAHYPATPYSWDARQKATECMKRLSEHEVYVGNFYFKKKKYFSAIQRYEAAISKYPSIPLEAKILLKLADAYRRTDRIEQAKKTWRALIQQYPKSKYAEKAKRFLDSVGSASKPTESVPAGKTSKPTPPLRSSSAEGAARSIGPRLGSRLFHPQWSFLPGKKPDVPADHSRDSPPWGIMAARTGAAPILVASLSHSALPSRMRLSEPASFAASSYASNPENPAKRTPAKDDPAKPQAEKEEPLGFIELKEDRPINITADRMEAFQKKNLVVFEGNVVVRQDEVYIYADRITAELAPQDQGGGIRKVVALHHVRITQQDRAATCERAEFDNVSRTIELSGQPKIWQGKDRIDGEKVVVHLDQQKMTVIGGAEKRVSAVLYPKSESTPSQKREKRERPRPSFTAPLAKPGAPPRAPAAGREKKAPPASTLAAPKGPLDAWRSSGAPPHGRSPAAPDRVDLDSIQAFVRTWRKSWESEDLDTYMACYSRRFRSARGNWKRWREIKAAIYRKHRNIRIHLEALEVTPRKGVCKVSFVQHYTSDTYRDSGVKTLELVREQGGWKILRESWKPLAPTTVRRDRGNDINNVGKGAVSEEARAILDLLNRWRNSWVARNPDRHFALYSDQFRTDGMSLGEYRKKWTRSMTRARSVRLDIREIIVSVGQKTASVLFLQDLETDGRTEHGKNRLVLEKVEGGSWRILESRFGGL